MVVNASDSFSADAGLTEHGSSDMPLDLTEAMPDGDDLAVPSDELAPAEVPAEAEDESADPTEVLRTQLEAELRTTLQTEYERKFQQDKANLQRTLNQQLRAVTQEKTGAQLREQELRKLLAGRLTEYGLDQREIEREFNAIDGVLSRVEKQAAQQTQQIEQGFRQTAESLVARHSERLKSMAFDEQGQQLFDPNDPDIQDAFFKALGKAQQHYTLDSGRAGSRYEQEATAAFENVKELIRIKREHGIKQQQALARQAAARKQQQTRQAQKARGPQNTAAGGGAPGASIEQIEAAVRAEFTAAGRDPNRHYNEAFNEIMRRYRAQGA